MYGPGGLGPLLGRRDSRVHRAGDDHGARKLLAKEQHAGWTAAEAKWAEVCRWPSRSSYLETYH